MKGGISQGIWEVQSFKDNRGNQPCHPRLLWGTVEIFITNSCFYKLIGLIGMFDRGINVIDLVNNNRYCPSGIYGDKIEFSF